MGVDGSGDSIDSLFPKEISRQTIKTPTISHRRSRSTDNRGKHHKNFQQTAFTDEFMSRPKATTSNRAKTYKGATQYIWDQRDGKGLEKIRAIENDEFSDLTIDREFQIDMEFLRSIDWELEAKSLRDMDLRISDDVRPVSLF